MKVGSGAAAAWREGGREAAGIWWKRGETVDSLFLTLPPYLPANDRTVPKVARARKFTFNPFIYSELLCCFPAFARSGWTPACPPSHEDKSRDVRLKNNKMDGTHRVARYPPRTGSHLLTPITFPVILMGAKGDCASIITSFLRHTAIEKELWWGSETRPINIEQYRCQWHSKSCKG